MLIFSLSYSIQAVSLYVQLILFMLCGLILIGGLNTHLIMVASESVLNYPVL